MADPVGFFDSLSVVGWLGILVWVGFFAWVLIKGRTFINYEERFPKFDIWDEFLYEDWHYFVFMIVRFFLILFIVYIVTKIMFII